MTAHASPHLSTATSFSFQHFFPQLYPIQLTGTFAVCFRDHSILYGELMQTATTSFNLILHGPFLTAILSNRSNFGKHALFRDHHLFAPHFIATRHNSLSLHLIPEHYRVCLEATITFKSEEEICEWMRALQSLRALMRDLRYVPTPLRVPAALLDARSRKRTPAIVEITGVEPNARNPRLAIESSERSGDAVCVIPLSASTVVLIADVIEVDQGFLTLSVESKEQATKLLLFDTQDAFYTVFAAMHAIIERMVEKQRVEKKPRRNIAEPFQTQGDEQLEWPKPVFAREPVQLRAVPDPPPLTARTFTTFPRVPVKASTELQLLTFEGELRRRVLVIRGARRANVRAAETEEPYAEFAFDDAQTAMRAYYVDTIAAVTGKGSAKPPFKFLSRFDAGTYTRSGEEVMRGVFARRETARETIQACNAIRYPVRERTERTYGGAAIAQLRAAVARGNAAFAEVCSVLASVFFVNTEGARVMPAVRALLANRLNFLDMIPRKLEPFQAMVVFVARMVFKGVFQEFIKLVLANKEWRKKNFWEISYVNNPAFLEEILECVNEIRHKGYTGTVDIDVLQKDPVLCERKDVEIHYVVDQILEHVQNGKEVDKLMIAKIIDVLCKLFVEGFVVPKTAILPELRHGWYCMYLASKMKVNSPEMIAFRKAVSDACMSFLSPLEMMIKALNVGFNCGMVGLWVLYMGKAAKKYGLYNEKSDLMDNEIVVNIADSLQIFSSLLIDMSDEELFENIKKCNY